MPGDGTNQAARPAAAAAPGRERARARLSEVWMLVDFVAGLPNKGLGEIRLEDPATGKDFEPKALLASLNAIQDNVDRGVHTTDDCTSIEVARDALNVLVRPASGLTVAYTTLVSGPLRGGDGSRFQSAQRAYPNLERRAGLHRWLQVLLLAFAVGITGLAAWESTKVALGKALLQNLDVLQAKQDKLNIERTKLELKTDNPEQRRLDLAAIDQTGTLPLAAYRLCDRPIVAYARSVRQPLDAVLAQQLLAPAPRMLAYATAEESDLCGQDDILRANLGIAHADIRTYTVNWPSMMGSAFSVSNKAMHLFGSGSDIGAPHDPSKAQTDFELRVAPVLLVWGNFVLPIIFATIGSTIFVILDNYKKVGASILDPRDFLLAPVRLALGLVVGACVGLFFSAYGPLPTGSATPTAASLISSLTLTASGIAFLAGFGVETVFTLLDAAIARMFSLPSPAKP